MNIVRIGTKNKESKLYIFVIIAVIFVGMFLILSPVFNIKKLFLAKKEKSMQTEPSYESLRNTEIVFKSKYSSPVSVGNIKVNNDNSMIVSADPGMNVKSIGDGLIYKTGRDNVYGNYIEIGYSGLKKDEIYAFYAGFEKPINGDVIPVQEGQKLGEVGSNGKFYFEIRDKDHNRISPYEYINLPIYENN